MLGATSRGVVGGTEGRFPRTWMGVSALRDGGAAAAVPAALHTPAARFIRRTLFVASSRCRL